jgi:hypothetical protein
MVLLKGLARNGVEVVFRVEKERKKKESVGGG